MEKEIWINPIGGHGDTLMISGVLKLALERRPERKYNLIRRTSYLSILKGHPAIDKIGFPPKGAAIQRVDYWSAEDFDKGKKRAFQELARLFGLETPVPEKIYVPEIEDQSYRLFLEHIPWKQKNVVIAPGSASPRKAMAAERWHAVGEALQEKGAFVLQLGAVGDVKIKNAYGLLGLTTPMEAIELVKKADLVITSDNFFMHAAHCAGVPAVVVWGPTAHGAYGYEGQTHLQAPVVCDVLGGRCISSKTPQTYASPCQFGFEGHCMNRIKVEEILAAAGKYLG